MKDRSLNQSMHSSLFNMIPSLVTVSYLFLLFCVFPLYFQDSYINILEAKTSFFILISSLYAAVCILLLLIYKSNSFSTIKIKKSILMLKHPPYFFALIFFLALVCSTLFSESPLLALKGTYGKLFGAGVLFLCILIFICISCTFHMYSILLWGCLISNCINFTLIILNRFGLDPLHMYDSILASSIPDYLGTLGQINIVSGYICIFLPLFMGLFLYSKKCISKIIYAACLFLSITAGICSNSDSFFLGLGASLLFYLCFSFSSRESLLSYACLPIIISASSLFLKLWTNYFHKESIWRATQLILIQQNLWIPVFFLFTAITIILYKTPSKNDEKRKILYRRLHHLVFIFISISLALFILHHLVNAMNHTVDTSDIFLFSDAWGTNRGYVWNRTVLLWKELPLREKLFGVGPGGFQQFFSFYYAESIERFGYYFTDAHNEFLQFLVTTGIFGVIGYFGMILSCMILCIKSHTHCSIIIACILFTALVQGIVNNPLVFITPFLFVFMGIETALAKNDRISS